MKWETFAQLTFWQHLIECDMEKSEKIEDLYKRRTGTVPVNIGNEIGHFNLFNLEPFVGNKARPVPYRRRDFYKIMLVIGNSKVHYADKVIEVKKQALTFSNPLIPYKWEDTKNIKSGVYCVFDDDFFHDHGDLHQYSVFQPGGSHVFELEDKQVAVISEKYSRMFEEIESDYIHKYDVLRNIVFELIHYAMKMQPTSKIENQEINAASRITMLFQELLERQFPIDETHQSVKLRTPSEFAEHMNVHVNHLNRALKETTGKTTSEFISERILKESKILLKQSHWNISEIGYSLGFSEATHFSNFFKKHTEVSPTQFRNV